ncbi:unnamed protein product [Arctia plantaginis]|uniref:Uncharacterized protein n=1 Tax=Arctia plantaginis TaxID=874455 RepID=A0A8S0ZKQ6_ARCPL|nr:unnamed protein product [Arctia plantaginis]
MWLVVVYSILSCHFTMRTGEVKTSGSKGKLLAAVIVILLFMEVEASELATIASLDPNVEAKVVTQAPVKLNITVIPMPEGYQDSKNWTSDSVLHLLRLINGTEAAAIINNALDISNTTKACIYKIILTTVELTRTNEKSIADYSKSVNDVMFNITNYKEAKLAGALISGTQLNTTEIAPVKGKKEGKGSGGRSDGGDGSQDGSSDGHPTNPGQPRRSGDAEILLPKMVKEEVVEAGMVKG